MLSITNRVFGDGLVSEWRVGDPSPMNLALGKRISFLDGVIEVHATGDELLYLNEYFDGLPNVRCGGEGVHFVGDWAKFIVANIR